MAPNSISHTTRPGSRPIYNKVTAQHTLERVRNNQRRHRARRKDYIATLEEKLSQAEQSTMILRSQVDTLEAELAQHRSQNRQRVTCDTLRPRQLQSDESDKSPAPLPSSGEADFQARDLFPDAIDQGILTSSSPVPFPLQLPDILSGGFGPELFNGISPHAGPDDTHGFAEYEIRQALDPLTQLPSYDAETPLAMVPNLGLQKTSDRLVGGTGTLPSTTAPTESIPTVAGTCCSDRYSSKPDDDKSRYVVTFSQEYPPSLPEFVLQPSMPTDWESTILCAEAYLLIAQQNFKGVDQNDVATWLWKGFRQSLSPGEGCRVRTDLLFSLLEFISDASSRHARQLSVS